MSGIWGVETIDGVEIIKKVWPSVPTFPRNLVDGYVLDGLTLRFPQTGEFVDQSDTGKRFDGFRPAAVIRTANQNANETLRDFHAQILVWEAGLVRYGPDVYRVGTEYLNAGWQAAKHILKTTSFSSELATKIFTNASLGALDITSPEVFADSAYALKDAASPTAAALWVNPTSGERVNLANSHVYVSSLESERPFTMPADSDWR